MDPLTPRQNDILHYISDVRTSRGVSPLMREIGAAFSITVASVQDHLDALRRKGYLGAARRARRGIRLMRGKREWRVRRTWRGEFEKRFGDRLRGETDLPGLFALVREGFPTWLGVGTADLHVYDSARRAWRGEAFFGSKPAGASASTEISDPLLAEVLRRRRPASDGTALAVPVLDRDRVLGALRLGGRIATTGVAPASGGPDPSTKLRVEPQGLDDAATQRAALAAAELAPVVARASLDADLRRGIRTQATLVELIRSLNRSESLQPFLHSVYEIIARLAPVGYFIIAVKDEQGKWWSLLERDVIDGEVWINPNIESRAMQSPDAVEAIRKSPYYIKHRTPEEVRLLEARGPHRSADGYLSAGHVQKRSRSFLYVPLRSGKELIGHISAQSYRYNAYTLRHAEDLILIAEYVGLAVQHAWRLDRERRELAGLRAEASRLRRQVAGQWNGHRP